MLYMSSDELITSRLPALTFLELYSRENSKILVEWKELRGTQREKNKNRTTILLNYMQNIYIAGHLHVKLHTSFEISNGNT